MDTGDCAVADDGADVDGGPGCDMVDVDYGIVVVAVADVGGDVGADADASSAVAASDRGVASDEDDFDDAHYCTGDGAYIGSDEAVVGADDDG